MTPVLRFHNASSRIPIFECGASDRFILSAPTGWGKSIFLQQLALLRNADTTHLEVRGKPVDPSNVTEYRRKWIYVAQTSYRSYLSIEEHLNQVLALKVSSSLEKKAFHLAFQMHLEELGMGQLSQKNRKLSDFSGGERQVAALVRSVLLLPDGLFLDEPTSAMDPALSQRVEEWLVENFPGTWIWVTHDLGQADRLKAYGARYMPP